MNFPIRLTSFLSSLIILSAAGLFAGCSSDDDNNGVVIPVPDPAEGITGIWDGTLTRKDVPGTDPEVFDFGMLFYMAEGETRGESVGTAFRTFPDDDVSAHFLIMSGYQEVDDFATNDFDDLICDGAGWAVGRLGTNATFLREFSYETGSQAGPDQRGAMCLQLAGNRLTGELKTENYGTFLVELTYSDENLRDSGVADLASAGSDVEQYHLWSNDNTGTSMSYSLVTAAADSLEVDVVEDSSAGTADECGSAVKITDIAGFNLYKVETLAPHVVGCNYVLTLGNSNVDRSYAGLGTLVEDNGTDVFVHVMGSYGEPTPVGDLTDAAVVLYNAFTQ
jgi:hypothetical protein